MTEREPQGSSWQYTRRFVLQLHVSITCIDDLFSDAPSSRHGNIENPSGAVPQLQVLSLLQSSS